jgi:hypothetical protein
MIYTGRTPRALWQRWRLWRAYNRPVTFRDLQHIAYDAARLEEAGQSPARALFDAIVAEATRGIIDHEGENRQWIACNPPR